MSEDERKLRDQIQRYRNLKAYNRDAAARQILDNLIKEAQAKLDGMRQDEG